MRSLVLSAAAGLCLALVPAANAKPVEKASEEGGCGGFGTAVEFVGTPSEAARKALKEEKLVFVLHVSGIFEDPTLT